MSDTQWPRFEVFQQERPSRPHRNVGSVHAPDAEMALLNARDVFVRRPRTHHLWVAPAAAILARTAEELAAEPNWPPDYADLPGEPGSYYVFQKKSQRQAMTYVVHRGEVTAHTPLQALHQALGTIADADAFVWWVVPATAVTGSSDADVASMFAPAADKTYRSPREYRTVTQMRRLKSRAERDE